MNILTIFNNKGGVGKTTLTFHLAHALSELGHRVLMIDLDPQCNLTIYAIDPEEIGKIWEEEDAFIEDFSAARKGIDEADFDKLNAGKRSIHFLLKPTEDGTAEPKSLSKSYEVSKNLSLIPGRLTLHLFEAKVGERWSGVYQGDPLAIRTATRIREIANQYADEEGYDIVILDTSPSLGALNRTVLSSADAFIIPAAPDLFSLYGIRNIGSALAIWKKQFNSIFHFLSDSKRNLFPPHFVKFIGFTLYNAKRLQGSKTTNNLGLATAHFNYAQKIPETIFEHINPEDMIAAPEKLLKESMGKGAVIHGHNTLPSMAQKYHLPMWQLPDCGVLEPSDTSTIKGNRGVYDETRTKYHTLAKDITKRLGMLAK
jgi:cellulose biosynthesis protein BcsQ